MSKLAIDYLTTNIDIRYQKWYKYVIKGLIIMIVEEINILKKKLEDQIMKEDSYDKIYETSIEIDKLLVDFYKSHLELKKGSKS